MENRAERRRRRRDRSELDQIERRLGKMSPEEMEREGYREFIHAAWVGLAALAYEGYLEHGRGAVLLRGGEVRAAIAAGGGLAAAHYFVHPQLESFRRPAPPTPPGYGPGLGAQVLAYDPELEAVIGVDDGEAGITVFRIGHVERTPPRMLEEQRRQGAQIPRA